MQQIIRAPVFLFALVLAGCNAMATKQTINAIDEHIKITGRYLPVGNIVTYDWAGVKIAFRTDAPLVQVNLDGGYSDYNIWVDKKLQQVWRAAPSDNYLTLTFDQGIHLVEIEKRNDPHYAAAHFNGLYLPQGGKLYPVTDIPKRKIEFIGDSYTVGYGAEGPGVECDNLRPYENVYHSFASLTARALDAEAHFVAMSGKGVVRNYGDSESRSDLTQFELSERVLASRPQPTWDAQFIKTQQWQPDAVVIKLGNNDYSTEPHPDSTLFITRLQALMQRVHDQYGEIPIVLFADTNHTGVAENVTKAYDTAAANIKAQLHLVVLEMPKGDARLPYVGCDWHPNVEGHKLSAEPLIEKLRGVLGE